ncbi:acetyl-CoA synthetase [Geobacter sp. OR-1]|uniref:hypothetical protein n=1 Tax=Geobacter sp. OR-1 TaxID=1266765 RepID=UPI0005419DC6|nr:hypothetical protein [Geobacter sp. OR-1]GAM10583.1 acetyl-CoA synthetase [Geobacter sp. OR-1]
MIVNNQFNIGHICTRLQCEQGRADKLAFRWLSAHEDRLDYTYADLETDSNRFANLLAGLEFSKGDVFLHVFTQNAGTVFCVSWFIKDAAHNWHSVRKFR